jgi:hypothetical protein
MDRVVRYAKLVRDNPMFQIDPTRVYLTGASLGSGAMHIASHNSAIFAAAAASIGWINDDAWLSNAPQNATKKVNGANGPLWKDYQDMAWMAQQGIMILSSIHSTKTTPLYRLPRTPVHYKSLKITSSHTWPNGRTVIILNSDSAEPGIINVLKRPRLILHSHRLQIATHFQSKKAKETSIWTGVLH